MPFTSRGVPRQGCANRGEDAFTAFPTLDVRGLPAAWFHGRIASDPLLTTQRIALSTAPLYAWKATVLLEARILSARNSRILSGEPLFMRTTRRSPKHQKRVPGKTPSAQCPPDRGSPPIPAVLNVRIRIRLRTPSPALAGLSEGYLATAVSIIRPAPRRVSGDSRPAAPGAAAPTAAGSQDRTRPRRWYLPPRSGVTSALAPAELVRTDSSGRPRAHRGPGARPTHAHRACAPCIAGLLRGGEAPACPPPRDVGHQTRAWDPRAMIALPHGSPGGTRFYRCAARGTATPHQPPAGWSGASARWRRRTSTRRR
jgi:hypothetical protein